MNDILIVGSVLALAFFVFTLYFMIAALGALKRNNILLDMQMKLMQKQLDHHGIKYDMKEIYLKSKSVNE